MSGTGTDQQLVDEARMAFHAASDPASLENAKAKFLGKSGLITEQLKKLGGLGPEQKKLEGARINALKGEIEALLSHRREALAQAQLAAKLAQDRLDISMPGRGMSAGSLHPVMTTWQRVEAIFKSMGFDVADGPEVETDWTNFTALNNPENHPARSMQDTFYLDLRDADGLSLLLRTHTSPMQVRYARSHRPPLRVIAPGRTYRVDSDATHSPMFHQVEGLWLGEQVSFTDLKGLYFEFLCAFFETKDLDIRFRPSFFPFTEPSAEVDMRFSTGPLKGRWLEISGAGQVHPKVIQNFGFDPQEVIGFAFGSGLERLTMLRYGIDDLRLFFENDLRFLRRFA
ncbi:MAG: phenylalanine--tRNA ligase subunit alpha [Pseudomonadota bacterium]|jgi:phenylalanyl-tRNA synthetase alpha chain